MCSRELLHALGGCEEDDQAVLHSTLALTIHTDAAAEPAAAVAAAVGAGGVRRRHDDRRAGGARADVHHGRRDDAFSWLVHRGLDAQRAVRKRFGALRFLKLSGDRAFAFSALVERADRAKDTALVCIDARTWLVDRVRRARLHRYRQLESHAFLCKVARDEFQTKRVMKMTQTNVNRVYRLKYEQDTAFAFLARKGGIALAISQEKQTNVEWLMARGNVAKHTMVARDEAFYRLSNRASTAIVHLVNQHEQHEALLDWAMKAKSRALVLMNAHAFLCKRGEVAVAATALRSRNIT